MQTGLIAVPKKKLIVLCSDFGRFFIEMSLAGTPLFLLFRRPGLHSRNPTPNQSPDDVDRICSASDCRMHGGTRFMVCDHHSLLPFVDLLRIFWTFG